MDIYTSKTNQKRIIKWRMATVLWARVPYVQIHFQGWEDKWDASFHVLEQASRLHIVGDHTDDAAILRCLEKAAAKGVHVFTSSP
jgi:hypothetical protein